MAYFGTSQTGKVEEKANHGHYHPHNWFVIVSKNDEILIATYYITPYVNFWTEIGIYTVLISANGCIRHAIVYCLWQIKEEKET